MTAEADAGRGSIRPLYASWDRYQRAAVEGLRRRSRAEMDVRAGPDVGPVWAIAAHVAGARVYWLCGVFGEPGAEATPFPDPLAEAWEDDLSTPRSADEVTWALESSWAVVAGCLDRWTPQMLGATFERRWGEVVQHHTRESVLLRLITHDAFHVGEISLSLGLAGFRSLDPWDPPSPIEPTRS